MENEPRKASDILLELEKNVNSILNIIKAQDLNIRVLSNKFSMILSALEKQTQPASKITVEAVDSSSNKNINISPENIIPVEKEPKGFRRTSRPETFEGDNSYLPPSNKDKVQSNPAIPSNAMRPPPGRTMDVTVPVEANQKNTFVPPKQTNNSQHKNIVQNAIPVMQRVVDGNGKSLFLADVEIFDANTMETVSKSRTNGTGKWMASLGVGSYKVIVRKMEKLTNNKKEISQDIQVDGSTSPYELQTLIIK